MGYPLQFADGRHVSFCLGKIVCVGRNYAEHAKELNNPLPSEPILFIKPESSAVPLKNIVTIPENDCHYETELAVLIGSPLSDAKEDQVKKAIAGIGLALDLTRRELQSELKAKGYPWEIAKSFDGACPLTDFVSVGNLSALDQLTFSLEINGDQRQSGCSADMLTPILPLIAFMSQFFTLKPGDVILTGTPKGVGELHHGDQLRLNLDGKYLFEARVA